MVATDNEASTDERTLAYMPGRDRPGTLSRSALVREIAPQSTRVLVDVPESARR